MVSWMPAAWQALVLKLISCFVGCNCICLRTCGMWLYAMLILSSQLYNASPQGIRASCAINHWMAMFNWPFLVLPPTCLLDCMQCSLHYQWHWNCSSEGGLALATSGGNSPPPHPPPKSIIITRAYVKSRGLAGRVWNIFNVVIDMHTHSDVWSACWTVPSASFYWCNHVASASMSWCMTVQNEISYNFNFVRYGLWIFFLRFWLCRRLCTWIENSMH